MKMQVVLLERDSVNADFRAPAFEHEWRAYPVTLQDQVVERLTGADIAIVNKLNLRAADIAALPNLRMVAVAATGADNVDLAACRARGIVVSNVRGYAVNTVPEHALMLMLALRRRVFDYTRDVSDGLWARSQTFCLFGHPVADLHGATLGIIGRGDLGRGLARLAEAFGMRVLFAEHKGSPTVRDGYAAFDEIIREADVISMHCPLTDATRGMIGEAEMRRMKPDAILINTARGGLIDEPALAAALRDRIIGGAGIDVLSVEPPRGGNPLLAPDIPNLILTPHMAWASAGAMQSLADQAIDNVEAFVAGQPRNRLA